MKSFPFVFLFILNGFSIGGSAADRVVTSHFSDVTARAETLGAELGVSNVLLVYDLDNTLLAMNQDLGSDQWFNWQDAVIKSGDVKEAAAPDFAGLLTVQGMLFSLSHMHPPEADEPKQVAELQKLGYPSLLLSARGTDFRDASERELARNGYNFSHSGLPPQAGFPATYLPYDLDKLSDAGLTANEAAAFKLGAPRPVSYQNGIYMVGGQHKGAMLISLLHKTHQSYKAIVFADDQAIHCDRMEAAFGSKALSLNTFRYGKEDPQVSAFVTSDKSHVVVAWNLLKHSLESIFADGVLPEPVPITHAKQLQK